MLTLEQIAELIEKHGSVSAASVALGYHRSTLHKMMKRLNEDEVHSLADRGMVVKKHSATFDKEGMLRSQSIATVQAPGEIYEVPAGHVIKGESTLLDPEGRTLARWVKTREGGAANLQDGLLAAFGSYEGRASLVPTPGFSEANLMTVYPLPDLHFGMHAWHRETGANYDLKIAADLARKSVQRLVLQSQSSKKAVLLVLGDYFHQNDQKNTTPRSGHRLDVDGRWSKVYQAGCELVLELVDLLLQKHEEVELVFLPGNHDEDAAVTLRVAMHLFYRNNPRISVYNEPGLAWYRRFGQTLMGAHHGHTMKPSKMALMLATDRREDWGLTVNRHFFFGHVHHETSEEVGPVRVESFNTPAARDAHAQDSGYRSGRSLTAITFDADEGEIGSHRVNIQRS